MPTELKTKTLDYLAAHNVVTLATSGEEGLWAAAVFYVNDGFDLYFLSAGHTRHAQNMATNPQIAATIQEDYKDWPEIKGIQLSGEAFLLHDEAQEAAIALYVAKYPYVATSPKLQPALRRVNWYRLQAKRLYMIDNSLGLGHRDLVIGSN